MKLNVRVSQLITFPQKLLPLTYLKLKNKIVLHCFLGVNGFVKIRITLPLLFFASFLLEYSISLNNYSEDGQT